MTEGYPRLLGDIGGTHARWAWQGQPDEPVRDISVLPCRDSASIYDSATAYLADKGLARPRWAGVGIATPITGDQVAMTNHTWSFSIAAFKDALAVERCLVINDFTALAMSLPALQPSELRRMGGGDAALQAPLALLGPGTGLGVSGLLPCGADQWVAIGGEGGHVTLAAADDEEAAVLALLRRRFGHASAERVLSGPGLVNLYTALCELDGVAPQAMTPAELAAAAASGADPRLQRVLRLFTAMLGGVAGNLALTLGALGGLYLGGGIVPRWGAAFDEVLFRRRFEDKGRYRQYLAGIPTWLITAATPALTGVSRALDVMRAA